MLDLPARLSPEIQYTFLKLFLKTCTIKSIFHSTLASSWTSQLVTAPLRSLHIWTGGLEKASRSMLPFWSCEDESLIGVEGGCLAMRFSNSTTDEGMQTTRRLSLSSAYRVYHSICRVRPRETAMPEVSISAAS